MEFILPVHFYKEYSFKVFSGISLLGSKPIIFRVSVLDADGPSDNLEGGCKLLGKHLENNSKINT